MNQFLNHEDIIKELNNIANAKNKYAKFCKCVFHIHTPASYDYTLLDECSKSDYKSMNDEDVYQIGISRGLIAEVQPITDFRDDKYDSIKEKISYLLIAYTLIQKNIEVVVVTDHNTIAGYEKLVSAIEEVKRVKNSDVFPQAILGIEVSCSDENHVIGIFDARQNGIYDKIHLWIDECFMGDEKGTYLTSLDVMGKINELNGITYIAHINSSNIFKQFAKAYKERLFNLSFFNVIGLSDMNQKENVKNQLRHFSKKKFNFVLDEDSHSIDQLGNKFFWLKGQKLNFNTIRNITKEFELSIDFEPPLKPNGYIKALYIENKGFLSDITGESGLVLSFSEAMNCIIGGRGSGKTTILNTLDFLLSQNFEDESSIRNICRQGTSAILYSFNNEDYYIFFNSSKSDEKNNNIFISRLLNRGLERRYDFNEQLSRKHVIADRMKIYNGSYATSVPPKQFLDKIYTKKFSVNNLVNVASESGINDFVVDLMEKNPVISSRARGRGRLKTIEGIEKKYNSLNEHLNNREKEVLEVISDFNSKQNDKLKIIYSQKKLIDFEFPWDKILSISKQNSEGYFKKFGISKIKLFSYLMDLSEETDPINIVLMFYHGKYKEILEILNVKEYLKKKSFSMIDEGIKEINDESMMDFMNKIRGTILKSEGYVIDFFNEYYKSFDDFNLEFNIHNKEITTTKPPLFKEVSHLSMGQKVVAMLSFILSYGEYSSDYSPLIIDQPEDNLDNQYIYKNLVRDLKEVKKKRQIIIATHNSTIVTNTQSEQVIVMESDNYHGWVSARGFPTEKCIIKHIVNHLEGGKDSFNHKAFLYEDVLKDN